MKHPLLLKSLYLIGTLMLSYSYGFAADHVIEEKDKSFSKEDITIKVGDSLTFENKDDVAHNVYAKGDTKEFEISKQDPGKKDSVTFDKAGEVKIKCAIHPKMKLAVKVEP